MRGFWKDAATPSFQTALRMPMTEAARPEVAEALPPTPFGRPEMIRKSLLAAAASLMTVFAFSGTLAVMTVGAQQGIEVA